MTETTLADPTALPTAGRSRPQTMNSRALSHQMASFYLVVAAGGALVCLGLVMVASAASVYSQVATGDPYYYGKRQIVFAVLGLGLAWLMSRLSPRVLRGLAWPAVILAFILVILTYTPLGLEVNGNQNWLVFGPTWTQFQPSEFAKLALIVWGAQHLAFKEKKLTDLRQWLSYVIVSLLLIGLVLIHDMGSAVVMTLTFVAILFLAGAPLRLIVALAALGSVAMVGLAVFQANRMGRIIAWLNPSEYDLSYNFQANHGLYALASGGFWGLGLGASKQKWAGLMSTGYTDYIVAIIGEELGLAGTLMVLILFVALAYAGVRVAARSRDSFTRLVVTGVTSWFVIQALVNIAVVFRCLPVL
ncbi:MAG: putative lipid II flippase FtsW, partial [Propionibacteriaceae bacterium]|nr:putative lipid II flippase FtsW [Propionibacteriaceae bacterium]